MYYGITSLSTITEQAHYNSVAASFTFRTAFNKTVTNSRMVLPGLISIFVQYDAPAINKSLLYRNIWKPEENRRNPLDV